MSQTYLNQLKEHVTLSQQMFALAPDVERVIIMISDCLAKGGKLLLCGNGGSAADCQHVAAEFVGRFEKSRRALPALALTTDTSVLTSIGNDEGYDQVFSRQVQAFGEPGDVLMLISTSGKSVNMLRAVTVAQQMQLTSIGLLGRDGGPLGRACIASIVVPSESTPRIQEMHLLIEHAICAGVERQLKLA